MRPIKTKVKKLWLGNISIRDYIVEQAKKQQRPIQVKFKNKIMTIPYNELDKGKKSPGVFKSKINNSSYSLIDYPWKPDDSNQSKLF